VPINIVVAAILALIALAIGRQMAEIGRNRTSEALHAQQK
jgi:hypothetical protein